MAKYPLLKIFTDGGSRGNPGMAGIGVHVTDGEGETVYDYSAFLGKKTNNEAEYQGLIQALEWLGRFLVENQVDRVEILMDSQLVVEQINKNWQIKQDHLQKLAEIAWGHLASLPIPHRISHIRREQNKVADLLANQAMDFGH